MRALILCGLSLIATPLPAAEPSSHDHILSLDHATFVTRYPARWAPTRDEAAQARAAALAWLDAGAPADLPLGSMLVKAMPAHQLAQHIAEYDFQYVGVYMARQQPAPAYLRFGDHVVMIHGFRRTAIDTAAQDPATQEIIVFDGADNFFDALYDVDTGKLLSFHSHGYA